MAKSISLGFPLISLLVTLGAAAAATKPVPPPPPPSVVPDKDPAAEKPISLVPAVKDKHPRLLFSAEDIPAMKKNAEGAAKPFFDMLLKYLPASKAAPKERAYQTNATDGQRQGFWRLPTVALHYVLTGDKASFNATVEFLRSLIETEDWETGEERNSGMSAANVMIGAALAYDWLYNDLEPNFREQVRQKLWRQARWQYHGGHLMKNAGTHYWQNDPQNNHRFHRDAGLTLCALAAYTGAPEEQWLLSKVREEVQFVADWLPDDGTSHESPSYMIFGNAHLTLAMQASDRCFGTKFLDLPFFRNNPLFRVEILTPGLRHPFDYGDSGGLGSYNPYLWELTSRHKLKDEQAALWRMFEQDKNAFMFGWFSLVWLDPSVTGGKVDRLPRNMLFPDLGIVVCRDGWDANGVGAMFKCGPYGGHRLNKFRNDNKFHYINVAHDDPDAGMFLLYTSGAMVAKDDGYAKRKVTSSHNTILVNGKGQRGEGGGWTQPLANTDMAKLAYLVTYKASDDIVIAEGEAGGMYPDLDRFRRTFIWVKGSYVVILDDIRAKKEAEFTWLVQGKEASMADKTFTLKDGDAVCDFGVVSNQQIMSAVGDSTADSHGTPMGLKQISLKAKGQTWCLATAFDLWGRKVRIECAPSPTPAGDPGASTKRGEDTGMMAITVHGTGFEDRWTWGRSTDAATPTAIKGERKGGWSVTVDEKDKAPSGLSEPVGNTTK